MSYPTELVEKAKYEVRVFERVSADTGILLIAEIMRLRDLVTEMKSLQCDCTVITHPGGAVETRCGSAQMMQALTPNANLTRAAETANDGNTSSASR